MEVSGLLHDPAALTMGKSDLIGGWVGPRVGLGMVEKRKIPSFLLSIVC
jgi:hypothetical protein